MYGFTGKILVIDLTTKKTDVLVPDTSFYRNHLGGSFLAAKLFDEQVGSARNLNPFSEANPIVFATGVLAGGSVSGSTRVNVFSLSPETPGVFLSQAGGEFGPNIKRAGYDAIILKGKSDTPVYLNITDEAISLEDASAYWGRDRLDVYHELRDKLDSRYAVMTIGVAGENRVCNANIMFEPDHYAGRGGLGAVIGAKNLKAICISGRQKPVFADDDKVKAINLGGVKAFKDAFDQDPHGFLGVLRQYGTYGLLHLNQQVGNLPVKNFNEAWLDNENDANGLNHESSAEKYVGKKMPCRGCLVACKKKSKLNDKHTALPEYESMASLGTNLGINDPEVMIEICELCNRLGVDSISMGNMIAFIMDCSENKVAQNGNYSLNLKFGDSEGAIRLIEDICNRKEGIEALLADGIEKAISNLGEETRSFARFSKGVGLPAHLPRVKPGIGFGYLHGPNPGDHMKFEHDWIAASPGILKEYFGLDITSEMFALDDAKVEIARATQIYYSAMDCLSVCMFIFGPGNTLSYKEIVELTNAASGFDYTFSDLMKIGEDAIQLQRKLFMDFGGSDEELLSFMEKEIPKGPTRGMKIDKVDFEAARKHYYNLWDWDESGRPRQDL